MLSKKMAFSLTSLITIFALVFGVVPAMAGFGISLYQVTNSDGTTVFEDVSHADKLQIGPHDGGTDATSIVAVIKFDRAVNASPSVTVSRTSKDGFQALAAATVAPATDAATADMMFNVTIPINAMTTTVRLKIGKTSSSDPFDDDSSDDNKSNELDVTIGVLQPGRAGGPDVWKIALIGEPFSPITTASFQTHILLSEEPKGGFNKDLIDVSDADVASVVKLASPMMAPTGLMARSAANNGGTAETLPTDITPTDRSTAGLATWRDDNIHLYLVTFNTKPGEKTVNIKVKNFLSMETPRDAQTQDTYVRKADSMLTAGRDILTVKTKQDDPKTPKAAGLKFGLPKDKVIPAGGYLVVAEDKAGSSVHVPPGDIDKTPAPHERNASELIYNVIDDGDLPNLETFLANGGSIGVMGPSALMITEIMWGSDASLDDPGKSQWIELYNAGGEYKTQDGDNTTYLIFYGGGETPAAGLHDLVGTVDAVQGHWSIAGKGQSGASGKRLTADGDIETTVQAPAISPIISMSRVMTGGTYAKGTLVSSWVQSTPPSSNFEANAPGVHIGSPGGMPVTFPEPPAPTPEPAPEVVVPVAMADDIMISEIMVDTDNGRLPQWIELTYSGMAKASLAGWSMVIDNAIDAGVLGGGNAITVSLGDAMVDVSKNAGNMGKGQSVLVVAWPTTRHSANIPDARVINVASQLGQTSRYQLLSYNGFRITLVPPDQEAIAAFGDIAGNLHEDWDIPMSEGTARSSLIRYDMLADGTATMGTDANGWVLADSTDLATGPESYYGDDEDSSTPGQHAGGPLPVELSHFRPARDKATGAVVITWATQSELNNAGFFIKRSNQKDGEFKVINATMVPGAGTTSEKQFYTYTDTTAQPNVVYYYQIEDVSLDGNRQTLTRGIRLKGHIGAAGKATTLWGELKSSNE